MRWRARYVDDDGREHTKGFARKVDAQQWLDNEVTAQLATGTYVAPEAGRVTVARGVRLVVGVSGPHLGQDGGDPAQRVE